MLIENPLQTPQFKIFCKFKIPENPWTSHFYTPSYLRHTLRCDYAVGTHHNLF